MATEDPTQRPDDGAWEERAAILEYDAGLCRRDAEQAASAAAGAVAPTDAMKPSPMRSALLRLHGPGSDIAFADHVSSAAEGSP